MAQDVRRAAAARDAASTRVRRLTALVTAACVGSTVLFAGLAAGSTHVRKVVRRERVPAPAARRRQAPVHAPAPPLVAVQSSAPAPAPPPVPAPAAVPQAPVVVSGGS